MRWNLKKKWVRIPHQKTMFVGDKPTRKNCGGGGDKRSKTNGRGCIHIPKNNVFKFYVGGNDVFVIYRVFFFKKLAAGFPCGAITKKNRLGVGEGT